MSTILFQKETENDETYKKIQDDVLNQHKTFLSLKQQHELLDQEIQQRIEQLTEAQQKRLALEEDIQTHSIQTLKKMDILAKEQLELEDSSEKAKFIQKKIKEEKEEQRKNLKNYEDKMNAIGHKLRSGPTFYERKNIQEEICSLREETAAVAKELKAVEKELNELRNKYSAMLNFSANSGSQGDDASFNLMNLKTVIDQMTAEKELCNSEEQKLVEELENLAEVSNTLRGELNKFKQVEITLN